MSGPQHCPLYPTIFKFTAEMTQRIAWHTECIHIISIIFIIYLHFGIYSCSHTGKFYFRPLLRLCNLCKHIQCAYIFDGAFLIIQITSYGSYYYIRLWKHLTASLGYLIRWLRHWLCQKLSNWMKLERMKTAGMSSDNKGKKKRKPMVWWCIIWSVLNVPDMEAARETATQPHSS